MATSPYYLRELVELTSKGQSVQLSPPPPCFFKSFLTSRWRSCSLVYRSADLGEAYYDSLEGYPRGSTRRFVIVRNFHRVRDSLAENTLTRLSVPVGIRNFIVGLTIKLASDEAIVRRERAYLGKLNLILVQVRPTL